MQEPPPSQTLPIIGLISGWGSPLIAWIANLDAALRTGCLALGFLISLSSLLLMWFPGLRPPRRPHDHSDAPPGPPQHT